MKKKPERIIDCALQLFNRDGLGQVTLRQIANEAEMSQGNLNYHFPKKDDIVVKIYNQFSAEMDQIIHQELAAEEMGLDVLKKLPRKIMELFIDYRFMFYDFAQIMMEYSQIKKDYQQIIQKRINQFTDLLKMLCASNIVKDEEYPGQYEKLCLRLQILADFWLSFNLITSQNNSREMIVNRFVATIEQEFFPYLTPEYKKLFLLE